MKIDPIEGSNIKGIGYDQISRTLAVQFASGTYHYSGVEPDKYEALLRAPSKGSFIHKFLKPHHKATKV